MSTAHVTVIIDGHWHGFDRGDLETAWLVRQELDRGQGRAEVSSLTAKCLRDEHGWDWAKAVEYAVAAANWDGKD